MTERIPKKGEVFGAVDISIDMRKEKGLHNYTPNATKYRPEKTFDQHGVMEDLPEPGNTDLYETPDYEFFGQETYEEIREDDTETTRNAQIKKPLYLKKYKNHHEDDSEKLKKIRQKISDNFLSTYKEITPKKPTTKLDSENTKLIQRPKGEWKKGTKYHISDQEVNSYKSSQRNFGRDANFKAISPNKLPRLFRKILEKFKRKEIQSDNIPEKSNILDTLDIERDD